MSQIGFAVKIVAPYFKEIPPDIEGKWLAGTKKGGPKAYQGIKKAIKTRKDFKEKIAKPLKKTIASFVLPFISFLVISLRFLPHGIPSEGRVSAVKKISFVSH